jgi:phosphoserine phosphatase
MSLDDMVMREIKLVFFDMEGTVFRKAVRHADGSVAPSAWTLIAKELGQEAYEEEEKTKKRWNENGYSGYVEWMEDTIRIHQKYGLKKDFFEKVVHSVDYHKGAGDVFAKLKERGIRTALISGGFKANADRAQIDLGIDHAFSACEYFWNENGDLVAWNLLPCDYEGKVDFMRLIMKEHGLTSKECAFVGDGVNDIYLAKEVGVSIAFNGAERLQEATTYSVNQKDGEEDFRDVLSFLVK